MNRIYLIRHAKPSAVWGGGDDDPGLDEAGRAQAAAAAEALLALPAEFRPTRVVSSPLRRCRETAMPFADSVGATIEIEPAVGEIPTPAKLAASGRGEWLRRVFAGRWSEIEGDLDYEAWRRQVTQAVASRPGAAIFSHFVAINAVLTALSGEAQVLSMRPDHAAIFTFELAGAGALRLVERGREAATTVL
ncbi:MAG: histidine phosphatase family protein [Caulobacteraceae bacterium]